MILSFTEHKGAILKDKCRTDSPAGGVEADEDSVQAAVREAKEETGLQIEAGDLRLRIMFLETTKIICS